MDKFHKQKKENRRLWNISQPTAELLFMLILIKKPKIVLEIGTSNGFSTWWLARAGNIISSKIIALESDKKRYLLAKENLVEQKNIQLLHCLAEDYIPSCPHNFDMAFIDAGKIDYLKHLKLLLPKLNKGALIVADNVISHRHTVKEYLDFLKTDAGFASITLPLDDGLELSVFLGDKEINDA